MITDGLSEELPSEQKKPEEGEDGAVMSRAVILNSG